MQRVTRNPALAKALHSVVLLLALVVPFSQSACTRTGTSAANSKTPNADSVVNVAIWSNYLVPDVAQEFTKTTGIRLQVSNYSSNEELLAKMQAGASQYDVIVPSDYMIFAMIKLGLLKPLDYAKLPNAKALDPHYLKLGYDPENKFSVPFDWGTTGIAINRTLYAGKIRGWKDVFERAELAGKFTMLDDVRETIGAALRVQGHGINTRDAAQVGKARELLSQLRPRIKAFSSEPMTLLVNGEAAVTQAYVSDALLARKKTGGKVEYLVPEEGCTLWTDNFSVPATAPHPDAAHAFINFMLSSKSLATIVMAVFVAPANPGVLPLVPPDLQKDPNLFPADGARSRCEMIQDLGDAMTGWDRAWTEIKAGGGS